MINLEYYINDKFLIVESKINTQITVHTQAKNGSNRLTNANYWLTFISGESKSGCESKWTRRLLLKGRILLAIAL